MSSFHDFVPRYIKLSVFFMNLLFWILGIFSIGIGLHVHVDLVQPVQDLIHILNPACLLIILGVILFAIAAVGCIGTIRENLCLLRTYIIVLIFLLVGHLATGIIFFIILFSNASVNEEAEETLRNVLIAYREDEQSADYINYVQATMQCCGIGPSGYKDWSLNPYFQCSDTNVSPERCNVPPSCCRIFKGEMPNLMCGHDITNDSISKKEASSVVYVTGCVIKIEESLQNAAVVLGVVAFGVAVPILCGLVLSTRMMNCLQTKVNNYYRSHYLNKSPPMVHYIPNSHIYHITEPRTMNMNKHLF